MLGVSSPPSREPTASVGHCRRPGPTLTVTAMLSSAYGATAGTEQHPARADAAVGVPSARIHAGLPRALRDSFSVRFVGFERPMVMISDPAAIKALYTERSHGLPAGRNIVLEPILGSRSLLLQEGAEHLARRKLMLPAFHGERMRSYESMMQEIVNAEIDSWPLTKSSRSTRGCRR